MGCQNSKQPSHKRSSQVKPLNIEVEKKIKYADNQVISPKSSQTSESKYDCIQITNPIDGQQNIIQAYAKSMDHDEDEEVEYRVVNHLRIMEIVQEYQNNGDLDIHSHLKNKVNTKKNNNNKNKKEKRRFSLEPTPLIKTNQI